MFISQLRELKGIPALVKLFTSPDLEVQRYATGAMRNAIYENMENKAALIEAGGIPRMVEALNEPDSDLRKNITGQAPPAAPGRPLRRPCRDGSTSRERSSEERSALRWQFAQQEPLW